MTPRRVWVRFHGDDLIVTAVGQDGPVQVARHGRSSPGSPVIDDAHYPPRSGAAIAHGERTPRATSAAEAAFLALGPGAAAWLVEAAAAGARGVRRKMTEAVALAKLHPPGQVDQALGTAAIAGRFAENDLLRILAHQAGETVAKPATQAGETHSLQPGTAAWSGFGLTPGPEPDPDPGTESGTESGPGSAGPRPTEEPA